MVAIFIPFSISAGGLGSIFEIPCMTFNLPRVSNTTLSILGR